jgi:uncharacterized protein
MNGGLPERIDPLHLADHHVRLSGQLPLARFRRLCEALCGDAGTVAIEAEFGRDESGQRVLHLSARAPVEFTCQRCMMPMASVLVVDETLGIVQSDAEADRLGGRYEPLMVDPAERGRMSLADMVEDEMLLQVPMIPRHDGDRSCQPAAPSDRDKDKEGQPARRENPFAVLKALKEGD